MHKNLKKGIYLVVFLMVITLVFSCNDDTSDSDVDFSSHNTNYSIMVRNHTGERLVAFKGELLANRLVGGIPAHTDNHGLPNNPTLFDKSEGFPLIILTEAQYKSNINNLTSQRNTPFTRVYVYYNKGGDNSAVYELSDKLGGSNMLTVVNNSTSINVELRVGGVAGQTLGFAPSGILETVFRVQDGNYNVFPVIRRYNAVRDVVETVYPKMTNGDPWFQVLSFGEGTTTHSLFLKDLLKGFTLTSGAAWVYIDNQTTAGGIRFLEGSNVRTSPTGLTAVMNGNPQVRR